MTNVVLSPRYKALGCVCVQPTPLLVVKPRKPLPCPLASADSVGLQGLHPRCAPPWSFAQGPLLGKR